MTVKELTELLAQFDPDAMVYIPSNDTGKNDTVRFVTGVDHRNLPIDGIRIAPDVALLTGDMEHYVTNSEKFEDRMGDA